LPRAETWTTPLATRILVFATTYGSSSGGDVVSAGLMVTVKLCTEL